MTQTATLAGRTRLQTELSAIAETLADRVWLSQDDIVDRLDAALGTDRDAIRGLRIFGSLINAGFIERDVDSGHHRFRARVQSS